MDLPNYWLSEADNIILCGKIDWLEYFPETDSVHIIDFKTGKNEESANSLQLPIYYLLASNCQKRAISKMSYWYLDKDIDLTEKPLPDADKSKEEILKIAINIKVARQFERFKCSQGDNGCHHCRQFEAILRGDAEMVGVDEFNQNIYVLTKPVDEDDSMIL